MAKKIYKRPTLVKKVDEKKNYDYPRKRNVVMNFRVSESERNLINARMALSGLNRSEYFIESCLYQKILVKGNIKSFGAIKDKIADLNKKIDNDIMLENLEPEERESLRMILEILNNLFGKEG